MSLAILTALWALVVVPDGATLPLGQITAAVQGAGVSVVQSIGVAKCRATDDNQGVPSAANCGERIYIQRVVLGKEASSSSVNCEQVCQRSGIVPQVRDGENLAFGEESSPTSDVDVPNCDVSSVLNSDFYLIPSTHSKVCQALIHKRRIRSDRCLKALLCNDDRLSGRCGLFADGSRRAGSSVGSVYGRISLFKKGVLLRCHRVRNSRHGLQRIFRVLPVRNLIPLGQRTGDNRDYDADYGRGSRNLVEPIPPRWFWSFLAFTGMALVGFGTLHAVRGRGKREARQFFEGLAIQLPGYLCAGLGLAGVLWTLGIGKA